MDINDFAVRLFLALFLGAAIGIERQIKQRSAGLITNSLVSLGACVFILISLKSNTGSDDNLRVVGQIVTGIGFLGAGVIMRDGFTVHGLNSAATIWCSAAVGCLAGFDFWREGILVASTIVFSHLLFRPIIRYLDSKSGTIKISMKNIGNIVKLTAKTEFETEIKKLCMEHLADVEGLQLRAIKSTHSENKSKVELRLEILSYDPNQALINQFIRNISETSSIEEISIETLFEERTL